MSTHNIGIIMNGVTGRMGTNQHLIRSIVAIRNQGGIKLENGDIIMPDPILMGRNEEKLKKLVSENGLEKWSTDLDSCLADKNYQIYFDALSTSLRPPCLYKAIEAGKHIYSEKPVTDTLELGLDVARKAEAAGLKNGVVQDKLWLPGLLKLKELIDEGFFGKLLAVRGEFGYWVFDGKDQPTQRPSWNYRKEDGGGIVVDMLCHWRYVIDNLFGKVTSVCCTTDTLINKRWDENHEPYQCTADDAAYATFKLDNGIICHFNSSWNTRVRRDDLLSVWVDGIEGSAVAGLTKCKIQKASETPKYVWNPDQENANDYFGAWEDYEGKGSYDNAFKVQWKLFLKHVVCDEPFRWTLREGLKGIQLAEKALQSHDEKKWIDVGSLE